jgi:BNR repeat-like domain
MNSTTKVGGTSSDTPVQAVFNNAIVLAWTETSSKKLKLISSPDQGRTWDASTIVDTGKTSNVSPAISVFNGKLYMAYADTSNAIYVMSSTDGKTWSAPANTGGNTKAGPTICSFQGKLYLAWNGQNTNNVKVKSSADGTTWSEFTDTGRNTPYAPSMCAFNNNLFITWTGINTNKVKIISSANGTNWTDFIETGQTSKSNPSIAMTNNLLMIGFKAESSNNLIYITSTDGKKWTNNTKADVTSAHGPSLAFSYANMRWAYVDTSNQIMFGNTGPVEVGANKRVLLYKDSNGPKVNFRMYYDYQMNNAILIHPDTGSVNFNVQAKDFRTGADPLLAKCDQNSTCDLTAVSQSPTTIQGSFIPINANDLPPYTGTLSPTSAARVCTWSCESSGGNTHSRLSRNTTLPAISLDSANNQLPNIPCGLIGYAFDKKVVKANQNANQMGLGYPGNLATAFLNQSSYKTFHIAIDAIDTIAADLTVGFWGLDLVNSGTTSLLQNVPFYVKQTTPNQAAGTRQLKIGISADGTSPAALQIANFDTGTADAYRVTGTLKDQIAAYFIALAQKKNDTASETMINEWKGSNREFLVVKTSLLMDNGAYISLPFQFEKTPTSPLFTKDYYVKPTGSNASDETTLFFMTDRKNTFGLPFYKSREIVYTDASPFTASIYVFKK